MSPHPECGCLDLIEQLLSVARCPYDGGCGDFWERCPYHAAEGFLRRRTGTESEDEEE